MTPRENIENILRKMASDQFSKYCEDILGTASTAAGRSTATEMKFTFEQAQRNAKTYVNIDPSPQEPQAENANYTKYDMQVSRYNFGEFIVYPREYDQLKIEHLQLLKGRVLN